jgi:hypothetical protein
MDNARVQAAEDCIAEIQRLKMTRLPQPADSPDLSPCDLWFYGFAKQAIQDEVFDNAKRVFCSVGISKVASLRNFSTR